MYKEYVKKIADKRAEKRYEIEKANDVLDLLDNAIATHLRRGYVDAIMEVAHPLVQVLEEFKIYVNAPVVGDFVYNMRRKIDEALKEFKNE